jgi:acyl-CoA reductase-like NAD-dependent aldehyde dehydrogenase
LGEVDRGKVRRIGPALHLGARGNSAGIVLDDADLVTTVPQLLDARLLNNGQVCAAQARILAPVGRYDKVVTAFAKGMVPYELDNEAVAIANHSPYGLAGSVWSTGIDRAISAAPRMQAGTCAMNSGIVVEPRSPFGGFKQSGIGRGMGRVGVDSCLETRRVVRPGA